MDTEVLLIFIFYSFICFVLTYYANLLLSKTEYSRQELSDILPQISNMMRKVSSNYSLLKLAGIVFFAAIIAMIILILFKNWIINSALIPLLLYFIGPKLAGYFEATRVTMSDRYADFLENIFARYYRYIIAGFLAGFGTKLIDNWINVGAISFLWFFINFIVNTALIVLILREDIFE